METSWSLRSSKPVMNFGSEKKLNVFIKICPHLSWKFHYMVFKQYTTKQRSANQIQANCYRQRAIISCISKTTLNIRATFANKNPSHRPRESVLVDSYNNKNTHFHTNKEQLIEHLKVWSLQLKKRHVIYHLPARVFEMNQCCISTAMVMDETGVLHALLPCS